MFFLFSFFFLFFFCSSLFFFSHVLEALGGESLLHLPDGGRPARENVLDVTSLLHGDDSHVVLLVHPHEEVLLGVVEDSATVGPVASRAAVGEHVARGGLLEEEVVVDELLLFRVGHPAERVVLSGHLSGHAGQPVAEELLHLLLN